MSSFANIAEDDGIDDYDEYKDTISEKNLNTDVSDASDGSDSESSNGENSSDSGSDSDLDSDKKKSKIKKIKIDLSRAYDDMIDWIDEFKEHCDDDDDDNDEIAEPNNKNSVLLPWVEKFRPKTLNDVISHEIIVATLKKFIENKYFPHLLLSGPPGTGKTSAIMACARQLYAENYSLMVLDINASEERGIEVVRNKIKDFICTKGIFLQQKSSAFKLVILDEADAMTPDAQAMLVSFMEQYSLNVRFCLICNYIKKISQAIQSRCTVFKFSPLSKADITKKIKEVCKSSNTTITTDGIETLIKTSKGDMRKVLNTLQVTSMAHKIVNSTNITTCIGYPTPSDMTKIYDSLRSKSYNISVNDLIQLVEHNGYSLSDVITELTVIVTEKFIAGEITQQSYISILKNMRNIETNLTLCPNESVQLIGLVGLFKLAF